MKRTYKCPNCGAVKTIDQQEADESRVLKGEIPAFIWCMACPGKTHHWERVRAWGDDVTDRNPTKYSIFGTKGTYPVFNRKMRRTLERRGRRESNSRRSDER